MAQHQINQFMRVIDDPDIKWDFEVVGGRTITGRVINYLKLANGTPLTLMLLIEEEETVRFVDSVVVKTPARRESLEVPWTIIQTIRKHKESK